ncbi:competence protein CoiA family protein [Parazoarcus communis]|nr:competence protein CoiA family protein [Parazoarcus communis]
MRSIREVDRGLPCGCFCPACKAPLIAKKGPHRVHHFAHRGRSCGTGQETALHRMAKQILADERQLLLPLEFEPTLYEEALLPDELRWHGQRPDVVLRSESTVLHVEITVTHRCGDDKCAEITRTGIPTVEIDLSSAYRRQRAGWTTATLRGLVVLDPGIRRWLHLDIAVKDEPYEPTHIHEATDTAPQSPAPPRVKPRVPPVLQASSESPMQSGNSLLVFDPWWGLVPRDPIAREKLIRELNERGSN